MNEASFCELALNAFPSLREDFEEWDGLIHLQIAELADFTQRAIKDGSFETVSKCFQIATVALLEGNKALRNAICVSYLEHLDFRSEAGKQAKKLMPDVLNQRRNDLLDYNEQLRGEKLLEDDR